MWEKIKAIPPFIASIIAIVSAVIAAMVWTVGYFATQHQLIYVKCISDKNEELLSQQVLSIGHYNVYIKDSVKYALLNDKKEDKESKGERLSAEDLGELKKLEVNINIAWESLQAAMKIADEMDRFLQSGKCGGWEA